MTETDYYIFCIGLSNKENKELSFLRKTCWTIICGYADPKKMPNSERDWWPLAGDPIYKAPSKKKILTLHHKFMSLKFNGNGR